MSGPDILISDYSKPWLLFWVVVILCHGYMDYSLYRKVRGWARGMRSQPAIVENKRRVITIWFAEVFFQRQLFSLSFVRWFIHILIFWGFAGLGALSVFTVVLRPLGWLGIDGGLTRYFLHSGGYVYVKLWGDLSGLALLAGLTAALVRRIIFRPSQQISEQTDVVLLAFLLWLTLSGFLLEWLRLPLVSAGTARYYLIALFLSPPQASVNQLRAWLTAAWTIHALSGAALLIYLPKSKLMHSILAPLVIAMNARDEHGREDLYWPHVRKHRATGSLRD